MTKNNYYYNIDDDVLKYPNAWCYIIIGGRNTGKTYSCLKSCYINKRKFTFIKRTNEDVDLLCSGSGRVGSKSNEYGVDLSPFKSINRDIFSNVKAYSIKKGLGGFWNCNGEDEAEGVPIGYLISLNSITKFKGFDLSDCDWAIFDEFIPQPWDRISKREGEQLMDLYKTISRDREHRNKDALKLICLANATSISNPVMNILEITDIIADMQIKGTSYYYDENRGILIHIINDNEAFKEEEKKSQIYKAMGDTSWGQMALNNNFAYNDFTNIGKINMKNYRPITTIQYKHNMYYIYGNGNNYYMTKSKHNKNDIYNLNLENDQKRFYTDYVLDLKEQCINGKMIFESYTMYDLIINYKKYFII